MLLLQCVIYCPNWFQIYVTSSVYYFLIYFLKLPVLHFVLLFIVTSSYLTLFGLLAKELSIYIKWSWSTPAAISFCFSFAKRYQGQICTRGRMVALMKLSSVLLRMGILSFFFILWKHIQIFAGALIENQETYSCLLSYIAKLKSLALFIGLKRRTLWYMIAMTMAITFYIWQGCQQLPLCLIASQVQLCRCKENYSGLRSYLSLYIFNFIFLSYSFFFWINNRYTSASSYMWQILENLEQRMDGINMGRENGVVSKSFYFESELYLVDLRVCSALFRGSAV